jgi:hypothetical protein
MMYLLHQSRSFPDILQRASRSQPEAIPCPCHQPSLYKESKKPSHTDHQCIQIDSPPIGRKKQRILSSASSPNLGRFLTK